MTKNRLTEDGGGTLTSEPICDAHHHIWRLAKTPWLAGPPLPRIFGAYEPLRRDYLIEDFIADAAPHGVVKSVYVQVNVAAGEEVDEVAWVQSCADRHALPQGTVGFADLAAPDVEAMLDRERAAGHLVGVRQQLHWHRNPQYSFAAAPDVMNQPAWRRGLRAVAARGLVFELQVFPGQMADAARLCGDFADVTFVLAHAGMLEDRSAEGWRQWRAGMSLLAARENVVVKLSGLGTFVRACSLDRWAPVIRETVDLFGPSRALFGSNFPVESLWTTYGDIVSIMRQSLEPYTPDERRAIFHDTACRVYGL